MTTFYGNVSGWGRGYASGTLKTGITAEAAYYDRVTRCRTTIKVHLRRDPHTGQNDYIVERIDSTPASPAHVATLLQGTIAVSPKPPRSKRPQKAVPQQRSRAAIAPRPSTALF